jgi:glucose/arabinose dehydrogenase
MAVTDRPVRPLAIAVTASLALLLAACAPAGRPASTPVKPSTGESTIATAAPTPPPPPPVELPNLSLTLQPAYNGFAAPVYVTGAKDGSGRLFVVEQGGRIKVVDKGAVQAAPYLDVSALISTGSERGLLGLSFSPTFKSDGRMYVYYTDTGGNIALARYTTRQPSSDTPAWGSPEIVLQVQHPFTNHNGGCLQFGPDGMLYIGTGDGGSAGDPGNRSQNLSILLGKMLRIDVSKPGPGAAYAIPLDNPFVSTPGARPEVWMYGLRNPWRYTFDASTNALWIADVGQDAWEEVDYALPGQKGTNWGWHLWEGNHPYPPGSHPSRAGFAFPLFEYPHPTGESITGGYVYRGHDFPALVGTYLYADFIKGWVGGIRITAADGSALTAPQVATLIPSAPRISSFGVDDRGELYATDYDSGAVLRVQGTAK